MPTIPLPTAGPGAFNQQARSIPELTVRATPDAFGGNVADVNYRGNLQLMSAEASAAAAENRMFTGIASGVMRVAGEVWQRDQRLEAEARLQEVALAFGGRRGGGGGAGAGAGTGASEGEGADEGGDGSERATGDGSYRTRTLERFDERNSALIDGAQSPYQAALYREGGQRLRFQVERAAVAAETAAIRQQRMDNLQRLVEGAEVEIFRDPSALAAARGRLVESVNGANLSPSQRTRLLQETDRRLHAIAIERHMTSGNIAAAQGLMAQDSTITALGGLEATRAMARITRAAEEAADRARAQEHNRRLLDGTELVDPGNAQHRTLINEAFTAAGTDRLLANSDPNAVIQVAAIARRYGVVPPVAVGLLNGMALNGTPEQQIFALQSVATIEAARPGAFETAGGVHRQLRSEADDFRFLTSGTTGLGLPANEALARITERRSPEFQARAEARRTQLQGRDGLLARRTEAELQGVFSSDPRDPWFGSSAIGNPRDAGVMLGTYRRSFEEHFVRTGDEAMALSAAQADVRRQYGVTRQSGSGAAVVRNPIELRYPAIDGSHDWIRTQLAAVIQTERNITIAPADIFLESTRATDESLSRGGVAGGHPPPYAFYWRVTDPRTGAARYESIPGRLFVPDLAAAQATAAERAQAARAQATDPDASAPHNLIRRGLGLDIVPAPRPDPARDAESRRRTILDVLGFGARATSGAR